MVARGRDVILCFPGHFNEIYCLRGGYNAVLTLLLSAESLQRVAQLTYEVVTFAPGHQLEETANARLSV